MFDGGMLQEQVLEVGLSTLLHSGSRVRICKMQCTLVKSMLAHGSNRAWLLAGKEDAGVAGEECNCCHQVGQHSSS